MEVVTAGGWVSRGKLHEGADYCLRASFQRCGPQEDGIVDVAAASERCTLIGR